MTPGDILSSVDGKDVAWREEGLAELRRRPVGAEVEFGVSRAGGTSRMRVTLRPRTKREQE